MRKRTTSRAKETIKEATTKATEAVKETVEKTTVNTGIACLFSLEYTGQQACYGML